MVLKLINKLNKKEMTKEEIELTKEAIDFYNLNHFKGKEVKKQLVKIKDKLEALNMRIVGGSLTDKEKIDYEVKQKIKAKNEDLSEWGCALFTAIVIVGVILAALVTG